MVVWLSRLHPWPEQGDPRFLPNLHGAQLLVRRFRLLPPGHRLETFQSHFVRTRWTSGKRSDGLIGKIVSDAKCSIRDLVFTRDRSNSQTKEMSNWIGPIVKQLWNYAMHVLHSFFEFNINTTAFCWGRSSLHLLLLKSSMVQMSKAFSISYLFEPIDVVTFCTLWWPQLHSKYRRHEASAI